MMAEELLERLRLFMDCWFLPNEFVLGLGLTLDFSCYEILDWGTM